MKKQQDTQDIDFVQIGDKKYTVDSISEHGVALLNDIDKIDGLIKDQQLQLSVSSLARGALIERLSAESENFTETKC